MRASLLLYFTQLFCQSYFLSDFNRSHSLLGLKSIIVARFQFLKSNGPIMGYELLDIISFIIINGHLSAMKKTKSASLLKISSLAASSKKSVQLDVQASKLQRLTATRSSKNLTTLKPLKFNYQDLMDTDATSNDNASCFTRPATILRNKVASLHGAIERLENQLLESKQSGKNKSKDYEEELKKHEEVANSIKTCQVAMRVEEEKLREIRERIWMLHEDFSSTQMNIQQGLAQKQYCEEILQQYRRQHENEAAVVLHMFNKEAEAKEMEVSINRMQNELQEKQISLEEWKNEVEFELQEKIAKNKLIQLRIELMKVQEEANTFADREKLLKIRQILCTLVKESFELNRMVNCESVGEEGIQVFLCRKGCLQEYQKAVAQHRGKDKSKYESKLVEKYFKVLAKIQTVVNNSKMKLHRKISEQFCNQIARLRKCIIETQYKLKANEKEIEELNQKVELVFADESVAIIEHLREKKGKYELSQIKSTLKTLKEQQRRRIEKIKQVYRSLSDLKNSKFDMKAINYMNDLNELQIEKQKQSGKVKDLKNNLKNLTLVKDEIENHISMAVSKWGEVSCKKEELRQLYKDLHQLNNEVREAQMARFQEKELRTVSKCSEALFLPMKRSEIIAKSMRETLKLRINGHINRNKENQQKLNIKQEPKLLKGTLGFEENCRTRKPSVVETNGRKIENTYRKTGQDSLTAVLFSKLIN